MQQWGPRFCSASQPFLRIISRVTNHIIPIHITFPFIVFTFLFFMLLLLVFICSIITTKSLHNLCYLLYNYSRDLLVYATLYNTFKVLLWKLESLLDHYALDKHYASVEVKITDLFSHTEIQSYSFGVKGTKRSGYQGVRNHDDSTSYVESSRTQPNKVVFMADKIPTASLERGLFGVSHYGYAPSQQSSSKVATIGKNFITPDEQSQLGFGQAEK